MSVQLTLKMTDQFFDRPAIQRAARRAQRDSRRLSQAGAFVRRSGRSSMRKVKKRTTYSKPGQPPRAHAPDDFNLRKILFAWDTTNQAMIVGSVGGGRKVGGKTIPEIHEEGATISASSLSEGERRFLANLRRRGEKRSRGGKRRNSQGRFIKSGARSKKQAIAYIKKIEAGQIPDQAPKASGALHYAQRDYMHPALRREIPKFPDLWEGSVHS